MKRLRVVVYILREEHVFLHDASRHRLKGPGVGVLGTELLPVRLGQPDKQAVLMRAGDASLRLKRGRPIRPSEPERNQI
jgi:hypothetical protein